MIRRLLAVTGVAGSLLGATVVVAPAAVAAPGDPTQVALFVQYPGGGTRHWCVPYRSGMSGADVLEVADPTIGQSGPYAGFVLKIGGQGTRPTDSDYWAYWVTQNGTLTYSGSGVTSTRPKPGTVEAWHWNSAGNQAQPQAGSYASLCRGGVETTPAPAAPAPTSRGVAAPTGSGGGAGSTGPAATGDATSDPTTASTGSSAPGAGTPTAPASRATTSPGTGSTTPGTPASSGSTDTTPATASGDDGGGPGLGTTAGLLLAAGGVVGLGTVAVVARRRRLDQD